MYEVLAKYRHKFTENDCESLSGSLVGNHLLLQTQEKLPSSRKLAEVLLMKEALISQLNVVHDASIRLVLLKI